MGEGSNHGSLSAARRAPQENGEFRCDSNGECRVESDHYFSRYSSPRPPYFLCTACLVTPSAAAICSQVAPWFRARRTSIVSRRSNSVRSCRVASRLVSGLTSPVALVRLMRLSESTPSTLVEGCGALVHAKPHVAKLVDDLRFLEP